MKCDLLLNKQSNYISIFLDGDGPWTQPSGWSTEDPIVYRQFEDSARLTLHNGAVITTGKVSVY